MNIWIDAQLSPRLSRWLTVTFEVDCTHRRDLGLREAEDRSTRVPQTDGRRSALLGAIFPDCRAVTVVRDSRAVGDQVATAAEDESWGCHRCGHGTSL